MIESELLDNRREGTGMEQQYVSFVGRSRLWITCFGVPFVGDTVIFYLLYRGVYYKKKIVSHNKKKIFQYPTANFT
jgi:hypothetical protein